jgi:hypothetical protein
MFPLLPLGKFTNYVVATLWNRENEKRKRELTCCYIYKYFYYYYYRVFCFLLIYYSCCHVSTTRWEWLPFWFFYSYTAKKTLVLTKSSQVLPCCPMFTEWQHGNKPCKSRTYLKIVATFTATKWQHGNNLVKPSLTWWWLGNSQMSKLPWYLFPPPRWSNPPKFKLESFTKAL